MMADSFSPLARATVGICLIDSEGKSQHLRDEELERITSRSPAISSPEDSGSEEDEHEDAGEAFSPITASDPKTLRARIIKQVPSSSLLPPDTCCHAQCHMQAGAHCVPKPCALGE